MLVIDFLFASLTIPNLSIMKTLLVLSSLLVGAFLKTLGQDEVPKAAQEACACLKELDPEKLTKRDLNFSILGCISRPIDGIAEELKKQNAWADSLALVYLNKIGKEVHARCPEEFDRLKKKEVEVDPALLAIKPESELVQGFSQAVCNCLGVIKDVGECTKKVGAANEAELTRRFPNGDPFTIMMGIGMDIMFELADKCDAASFDATVAQLKKFPAVKDGCGKVVTGEFSTQSMLGETRSKFTPKLLQEYTDGKLVAEYTLQWKGCTVTSTCTVSQSSLVKKGEVTTMEIKRASSDGFIAMTSFGKMKVPVVYNKVK
jgi:hypothetical protein